MDGDEQLRASRAAHNRCGRRLTYVLKSAALVFSFGASLASPGVYAQTLPSTSCAYAYGGVPIQSSEDPDYPNWGAEGWHSVITVGGVEIWSKIDITQIERRIVDRNCYNVIVGVSSVITLKDGSQHTTRCWGTDAAAQGSAHWSTFDYVMNGDNGTPVGDPQNPIVRVHDEYRVTPIGGLDPNGGFYGVNPCTGVQDPEVAAAMRRQQAEEQQQTGQGQPGTKQQQPPPAQDAQQDAQRREQEAFEARRAAADSVAKADSGLRATGGQFANQLLNADVGQGRLDGEFTLGIGATYVTVNTNAGEDLDGTGVEVTAGLTGFFGLGRSGTSRIELGASGGWGTALDLSYFDSQAVADGTAGSSKTEAATTYGHAVARFWLGPVGAGAFADFQSYSASDTVSSVNAGVWSYGPTLALSLMGDRSGYMYLYGCAGLPFSSSYGGGLSFGLNALFFNLEYLTQSPKTNATIASASRWLLGAGLRLPW